VVTPPLLPGSLTFQAIGCPGDGLKAFGFDFPSTGGALAECALAQTIESLRKHTNHLPRGGRFVYDRLAFIFAGRLIGWVGISGRINPGFALRRVKRAL